MENGENNVGYQNFITLLLYQCILHYFDNYHYDYHYDYQSPSSTCQAEAVSQIYHQIQFGSCRVAKSGSATLQSSESGWRVYCGWRVENYDIEIDEDFLISS